MSRERVVHCLRSRHDCCSAGGGVAGVPQPGHARPVAPRVGVFGGRWVEDEGGRGARLEEGGGAALAAVDELVAVGRVAELTPPPEAISAQGTLAVIALQGLYSVTLRDLGSELDICHGLSPMEHFGK